MATAIGVFTTPTQAQEPQHFQPADARVTSVFWAEPGVLVEAAGLSRWNLEMLRDSLDATGQVLFGWGGLRSVPFFPQSVIYQSRADSAVTVFVAVVEDAALVTVRELQEDGPQSGSPWRALVDLAKAPFKVLEAGVVASIRARATGVRPRVSMGDRADATELTLIWTTLDTYLTVGDAAVARRALLTSTDPYERVAAVAILSNFDSADATWHALVGALLDPDLIVREYARSVLSAFASAFTRRVDWEPAAAELHAILQGSDLFFLPDFLEMLVATGVGPDLAVELLKEGGHAVLMFAGAKNVWARGPAHRFLRAVSGRDGGTPAEWREWIETL